MADAKITPLSQRQEAMIAGILSVQMMTLSSQAYELGVAAGRKEGRAAKVNPLAFVDRDFAGYPQAQVKYIAIGWNRAMRKLTGRIVYRPATRRPAG